MLSWPSYVDASAVGMVSCGRYIELQNEETGDSEMMPEISTEKRDAAAFCNGTRYAAVRCTRAVKTA